ncbi:MAG: hypothetical protein ACYDDF_01195 [Thermoplasmatota archaeon]
MGSRPLAWLFAASAILTAVSGLFWTFSPAGASSAPALGITPASADPTYEVTWLTRHAEQDLDGALSPGQSHAYSVEIDQSNLTAVEFLLSWTDPGSPVPTQSDTYSLAAADPNGNGLPASPVEADSNVLILRSRQLATVPPDSASYAADPPSTDAEASSAGRGNWTVTVTLDPGATPGAPNVPGSHTYILSIIYGWYEANVMHPVQLVPRTLSSNLSPVDIWGLATYALGGASAVLGTILILDTKGRGRRSPKSRLAPKPASPASPSRLTTPPPVTTKPLPSPPTRPSATDPARLAATPGSESQPSDAQRGAPSRAGYEAKPSPRPYVPPR